MAHEPRPAVVWLKLAAPLMGAAPCTTACRSGSPAKPRAPMATTGRARSGVVLTGMGTVLKDDPQLNARAVQTSHPPRKAVIDGRFEIPEDARLFDDGAQVLVFTARSDAAKARRMADRNARVIELTGVRPDRVDLPAVMRWLASQEINEVHVEAGAGLSGALLAEDCVDELLVYLAPVLLGDAAGMVRLPLLEHLDGARRFEFAELAPVGTDVRLRAGGVRAGARCKTA